MLQEAIGEALCLDKILTIYTKYKSVDFCGDFEIVPSLKCLLSGMAGSHRWWYGILPQWYTQFEYSMGNLDIELPPTV